MAVRLNLGCGAFPLKGFINVDAQKKYGEEHWDITKPPHKTGTVDEIFAGHVLEHLSNPKAALKEWHRVLKPGGLLTVVIPDFAKAVTLYETSQIDYDTLNGALYGYHDSDSSHEYHKAATSEAVVAEWLTELFGNAKPVQGSPHMVADVAWQSVIEARK